MIELMRELKAAGYRMAMLTNNVREWEPLWRPMLPVDEIFETVVDSGFVGCRKPESKIYAITLDRIGLPAESCLFVDDVLVNCEGAEKAGMTAVHFQDNEQAIAEIRAKLVGSLRHSGCRIRISSLLARGAAVSSSITPSSRFSPESPERADELDDGVDGESNAIRRARAAQPASDLRPRCAIDSSSCDRPCGFSAAIQVPRDSARAISTPGIDISALAPP